jgi:DnaK suppressor protein
MKAKGAAQDSGAKGNDARIEPETEAMRRIAAVRAAISRIDEGRYGICLICGNPIAPARLAIKPEATRCIACLKRA